jgi:chitin deacetylase
VKNLQTWYAGPKSPGLIILEHELSNDTVTAFIETFPLAIQNGWKAVPVTSNVITGSAPYRNADDDEAAVSSIALAVVAPSGGAPSSDAAAATPSSQAAGGAAATTPAAASSGTSGSTTVNKAAAVSTSASESAAATGAQATKGNGASALTRPYTLIMALLLALPFLS